MAIDKSELMQLSNDEKRALAFELLDSVDEEFLQKQIPEWKRDLIRERIKMDDKNPGDVIKWSEIKKKIPRVMNFELVFTKYAEIELHEIFIWYEDQSLGLGFKFITAFEECLNKISGNPYYASSIEKDARSASLKRFPYEVIYRINEDRQEVKIIAIIHQHRNLGWLKGKLYE